MAKIQCHVLQKACALMQEVVADNSQPTVQVVRVIPKRKKQSKCNSACNSSIKVSLELHTHFTYLRAVKVYPTVLLQKQNNCPEFPEFTKSLLLSLSLQKSLLPCDMVTCQCMMVVKAALN